MKKFLVLYRADTSAREQMAPASPEQAKPAWTSGWGGRKRMATQSRTSEKAWYQRKADPSLRSG
jgi:hypothetical protein